MTSLATSTFSSTTDKTIPVIEQVVKPIVAEASYIETLQDQINRISLLHGNSSTTLSNLVHEESGGDPTADNGYDRGIVQINRAANPTITDAQAFDAEWSLNWAARMIYLGEEWRWTPCNCYAFAKWKIGKPLPKMADIVPNTDGPVGGALAIFDYNGKKHVEITEGITVTATSTTIDLYGANYEPCKIMRRTVDLNDPHLIGFHLPNAL